MDNINGALGFAASLDINDFDVSADAMERHFKRVSTSVQDEAADMEQSLLDFARRGAAYISAYLVSQGLGSVLKGIVQVRGQFQQLEIAFGTMLGNEEQAKDLMDQMIQTAARTPFDLMGVAGGAKQLMAYGTAADKVNDTLVRLGNIASGLSIPLNDIVYLYGTTMVQGRLYAQDVRQFTGRGIPLVKELAKMYGVTTEEINAMVSAGKIGFADVEKVINGMTDAGGQFYNLMAKQSASLTGMTSNLSDAWDSMINDIGREHQDMFATAINSAAYLVEHYQKIIDIIKAVTIAYGAHKAALVANTLLTKGYTGVALIDNTVKQTKIALLKAEAVATGQVKAQTTAMQAAQKAHVAELEKELTAGEILNLQHKLRIQYIGNLLTAQQQEYLSNLGLTASSEGYEAAVMQILNVEQREAVQKLDLSSKSAIYQAALEQEVAAKHQDALASKRQAEAELEAMRAEVSASYQRMEQAKQAAVIAMQKTQAARDELLMTRQNGNAAAIAAAQKKLEGAEDNQSVARKAALAAASDFTAKKKALEVAATKKSAAASVEDATAKGVQTAATNIMASATTKATHAIKALWAAMKSNPLGWILTAVGLVISAFTLLKKREDETTDAMGEFQDATKKEIDSLEMLFAILEKSESGTKTHKDVLEKINSVCKDYNKTLLDENATLAEQKTKYEELRKAIQETTAEKVRAKYVEQAMKEASDTQEEALKDLKKSAKKATHKEFSGYQTTYTSRGPAGYTETYRTEASENIRNASDALWDMVEAMASDAIRQLEGLTGDAYVETYNTIFNNITKAVQKATKASGAEIDGFAPQLRQYLNSYIDANKKASASIENTDTMIKAFMAPKDPTPVTDAVDLVNMSFSDLESKMKAAQDRLAGYKGLTEEQLNQMEDAGRRMLELFSGGNVDLLARPMVDAAKLVKKGWEDAGEGIATVYSYQRQVKDSNGDNVEILVTPILPDGKVLSEDELNKYIDENIDGADDLLKADKKGIIIQVGAASDGSAGELLHQLQSIYYLCDQDMDVEIDAKQVKEATTALGEFLRARMAIETKEAGLNTDAGISARIKELRELIETEEYGSEQRRRHTQELLALQKKLDENNELKKAGNEDKTREQAERDAEALTEKQLEAQRKLEETRIEIMQEGYAKRKATLDLQHKYALLEIDREEKELEKARTKAGKGTAQITVEASNIRNAGAEVWTQVEQMAKESTVRLTGLTGQAYTDTYNQILDGIANAVRNATGASGAEIDAFKPKLKDYLDSYLSMSKEVTAESADISELQQSQAEFLDRLTDEAGKATFQVKGLTDAERALFDERRRLETQSYNADSIKLFDGEIEYKKSQYEAYFRWVRNVGKDVADTHFKGLMAEGTSFTAWINKKIAELEAKRANLPDKFNDGDAEALNALKMQRDEINGTRTAMDLFKDTMKNTLGESQNLAEQLQVIADLKERLEKGEFHLNADETAEASLQLNNKESELQQNAYEDFIKEYRTYEERKTAITAQYDLMRAQASKDNNTKVLSEIARREKEEISKLASDTYIGENLGRLLNNVEELSVETINNIMERIRNGEEEYVADMNEQDIKDLLDRLGDLKNKIASKNPFQALKEAAKAFGRESSKANLDNLLNAGDTLADNFNTIAQDMRSIAEQIGNEELAQAADLVSDIITNFQAAEKGAETWGGWWGAIIGGAMDLIPKLIKWTSGDNDRQKRIQDLQFEINGLSDAYDKLTHSFDNTYFVFTDEQRADFEQNVNLIKAQIEALEQERATAFQTGKSFYESFKIISEATEQITEKQKELEDLMNNGDMNTIYQAQRANLIQQQENLKAMIEEEKDMKNPDDGQIQQWNADIAAIDREIEDLDKQMRETFAGTSVKSAIDEFASAMSDAFAKGEDAAEALGKKTRDVLKNAVLEALKRQFLAKGITDAVNYLSDAMSDNRLSDEERARFESMVDQAGELYRNALEGVSDLIKDVEDTDVDALTGAVQGMSEETGGLVAGRLNAVIINQGDMLIVMRQVLQYQSEIASNTSYCKKLDQIADDVKQLRNGGNTLLSQGIA